MANRTKNVFDNFGDIVTSNMGNVSKKYRDKAPNDKSYFVTILGVNQKFVDSVPAEKQNELKTKHHIPETVEEGESNYYTIQINGEFYCVQQEGSFLLYDKVMAYLPNGDWSRMYLDYQSSNFTSTGFSTLFIPFLQTTDPAIDGEVADGDYWIQTTDNDPNHFSTMYKRVSGVWSQINTLEDMTLGDGVFVKVIKQR